MSSLLGLPLDIALSRLAAQGIVPDVRMTRAPRHPVEAGETRVVSASEDGRVLLAAVFPPPLSAEAEKEGPC